MFRTTLLVAAAVVTSVVPRTSAQVRQYPLQSSDGMTLHNVAARPVALQGKKGVRLTLSDEARRRLEAMTPEARNQARIEQLARITGLEFSNGMIDVELAGAPESGAPDSARGFVGIAFRVQPDNATYDAFYLRPTNGRAEDQERRNHSAQYISHPDWPWFRLRQESPGKYESYVDLVPNQWTAIRIDVRGSAGRLYVHGHAQPTLVVNDLKTGAQGTGGVALWLDAGTVAHFRNLRVTAAAK